MLQIIPTLNLINSKKEYTDAINNISLRGYLNKAPVTIPADFIQIYHGGKFDYKVLKANGFAH